jgi:hypothetical protein
LKDTKTVPNKNRIKWGILSQGQMGPGKLHLLKIFCIFEFDFTALKDFGHHVRIIKTRPIIGQSKSSRFFSFNRIAVLLIS